MLLLHRQHCFGPGGHSWFPTPETPSDMGERAVEHLQPRGWVYDGLNGHRTVVSVHNGRSFSGGRLYARVTRDLYQTVTKRIMLSDEHLHHELRLYY